MMRRKLFCLHLLIAFVFIANAGYSQISGVINNYTQVTSVDVANIEVTVTDASAFSVGDRALIIQMTGATIDETNTSAFGDLTAVGATGNYEILEICNIAGNDIAFDQQFSRTFDITTGIVQLVTIPQYGNISVSGTLQPAAWNGTTGGVLIFEASGTVTMNADISGNGRGFRGGAPNTLTATVCDDADYFEATATTTSGGKGEGIAAFITGKENARGKQANGGGGGNSWSAGGGGGSNAGDGGMGGNSYDGGGCNGDPVGGIAGIGLTHNAAANKVFLGGGGGAGHSSSGSGVAGVGAPGGGIVFVIAESLNPNGNQITANGFNGASATGSTAEGAGGGGAGGTVILDVKTYLNATTVQANGGLGGNNENPSNCYGPGGGGGGGAIWSTGALPGTVSTFVDPGTAGTKISGPVGCAGTTYGAANGVQGTTVITGFAIPTGAGPSPGADGAMTVCDSETNVNVENGLTAQFTAGGTWNDDDATGALTGSVFDASAAGSGTYNFTYTVTAGACADTSATVTVTVTSFLNAGTNNSVDVCTNGGNVDLFASLGGTPDAGGTWSDDDASGALSGGFFDPSQITPGTYDFTYSLIGQGACASSSATVSVNVTQAPNAGADGALVGCDSETAVDLSTGLGATFDIGGTWNDDDATGALSGGIFNASTAGAGTYNFTYVVSETAPCVNDSATITVTVASGPDAGAAGANSVCTTDPDVDLFTVLTGTPDITGSWMDDDNTGALSAGFFDQTLVTTGTYNFTYIVAGLGGCPADSATVQISVTEQPDAGSASAATVCNTEVAVDLFTLLGGTPVAGGSWNDDDATGAMAAGIFDATAVALGTYDFTYSVNGAGPCLGASATVTVTVGSGADAGSPGTTTVCSTETGLVLFTVLTGSPNIGGTWNDDDATGAVSGGIFDASQTTAGTYDFTYVAMSLGACPDDSTTISVTVIDAADAGNNGVLSVCNQNNNVDLFTGLLGTPEVGGTWLDNDATGALAGGIFDASAVTTGSYSFTYVVTGTTPCANDSADVTIIVTPSPSAGLDGTLDVCSSQSVIDLFTGLNGTPSPGGSWLDDDATGGLSGGFFNAGVISVAGVYDFTYIAAVPGCPADSATVSVTVTIAPNAGTDSAVIICNTVNNFDLFTGLAGTPDAGGTWNDNDATGALTGNIFDANAVGAGTYTFTYILTGTSPCNGAAATVTVSVVSGTDAGTAGTMTECSNNPNVNLFNGLGGTPFLGGSWLDDDATGALNGGVFDATQVVAGTYDFTYFVTATGCPNDSATVSVTVTAAPNSGTNGTLTSCQSINSLDLFTGLGGTPDLGGSWNDDDATGALTGSIFDPSAVATGTYSFTYTVTGTSPCANATSTVLVTVNSPADAGINGTLDVCDTEVNVPLLSGLGGTPDLGGGWNDDDATGGLNIAFFDASTVSAGTYDFTYIVAPTGCVADSATVSVTVTEGPDAGSNNSVTVCNSETNFDVSANLGGTPDAGGTWNDDNSTGALTGTIFDPSQVAPGVYGFTYTVAGAGPCFPAQATVFVIVTSGPDAGTDSTLTACDNDNIVDLFSGLGGTPNSTGTWLDDDNTGALNGGAFDATIAGAGTYDFTYIVSFAGCVNDSATVTVTVSAGPNAGISDTVNVCDLNNSYDLTTGLGGSPDAGGTWSDDDGTGALSGNNFNAVLAGNGTYQFTYNVSGGGSCPDASSTLTVVVIDDPNAGTAGQLTACSNEVFVDLFAGLGGTPDTTGVWTDDSNTGALNGGFFDASSSGIGNFIFTYTIEAAGCNTSSAVVLVTVEESGNAGLDTTVTVCIGDTVNLFQTLGGTPDSTGVWSEPFPSGGLVDSIFYTGGLGASSYFLTYTIAGGAACPTVDATVSVVAEDVPNAGTGDSLQVCGVPIDLFGGLDFGSYQLGGTWSDDDASGYLTANIFNGTDAPADASYQFTYTVSTTSCGSDSHSIIVTTCDNDGTIPVPEGFSPNGDGKNDWFVIDGIENYPNNTFTVYNRWGNVVYEAKPYNNEWDGRWDNESRAGEGLPIGTYFYILDLGNDTEPITGSIYLNR